MGFIYSSIFFYVFVSLPIILGLFGLIVSFITKRSPQPSLATNGNLALLLATFLAVVDSYYLLSPNKMETWNMIIKSYYTLFFFISFIVNLVQNLKGKGFRAKTFADVAGSWLTIVLIGATVIALGYTGYQFFQSGTPVADITTWLQNSIVTPITIGT